MIHVQQNMGIAAGNAMCSDEDYSKLDNHVIQLPRQIAHEKDIIMTSDVCPVPQDVDDPSEKLTSQRTRTGRRARKEERLTSTL